MGFRKDNHSKYYNYFDLWITESQVIGFSKQMYNNIFGSMYN